SGSPRPLGQSSFEFLRLAVLCGGLVLGKGGGSVEEIAIKRPTSLGSSGFVIPRICFRISNSYMFQQERKSDFPEKGNQLYWTRFRGCLKSRDSLCFIRVGI